jgi:hypothetical protein
MGKKNWIHVFNFLDTSSWQRTGYNYCIQKQESIFFSHMYVSLNAL